MAAGAPEAEERGTSFKRAARERLVLIVGVVGIVVGIAVLYSLVAETTYEARAELLVTPLPDDPAFAGLGLVSGPTPAATAAHLVESREIADTVATRLGGASGPELLASLDSHPLGESNVVAVDAEASDAARAAQIANGFADELVARASAAFRRELAARTQRLRETLSAIPAARRNTPRAESLDRQLAQLIPLAGGGDPTLEVVSDAVAPADAEGPRRWLIVLVAALLALVAAAAIVGFPVVRARRAERAREQVPLAEPAGGTEALLAKRVADEVDRRLKEQIERLERRSRDLEQRERDVEAARKRLDVRTSELTEREATLDRRTAELAAADAERASRERAPVSPPASASGPPQPQRGGGWNVNELERLVAEQGERHPERLDDWEAYLFLLREHAGPDGTLPTSFDWLVADVFRELVAEESRATGSERSTGL